MLINIIQIRQDLLPIKYNELIEFSRNCSWQGTGRYFADLFANNEFDNTEKIFATVHNDNIDTIYLCTASHEQMYMKFGFSTFVRTQINNNDDCAVMKLRINSDT